MRISSSVGSGGRELAGFVAEVTGFLDGGFFAVAGFFFFARVAASFFGSDALNFPLAEGAAASSAGLFSTGVFGFLATVRFRF